MSTSGRKRVEHEFVNCSLCRAERTRCDVIANGWQDLDQTGLRPWFTSLIGDLSTGLDVSLYEEAVTHFLGGPEKVDHCVDVITSEAVLGQQAFRLIHPGVALKITTLNNDLMNFETHARKLLSHTRLEAIQWINIARNQVTFVTLLSDN